MLGHGDRQTQLLPKKIEALAGQRIVAVSAGGYHSLARTADGSVWSWGQGEYGCLGPAVISSSYLPLHPHLDLLGQQLVRHVLAVA